jgi:hypothetical protein
MAFKDIHKLKKIVEVQKEFIETDYLVVGRDVFAISIYRNLVAKFGSEKVRLLSEDKIIHSDLFLKGPSTLRGEENRTVFKSLFPEMNAELVESASMFYKDLAWKSFGGRSKPETLKYDEEFYVTSRLNISEIDIYSWLTTDENFFNELNQHAYQVKIKTIDYKDEIFSVECINGTEFKAKKLFFGKSPSYFLKHYKELASLSDKFIQFCESTKTMSGLFIKYLFQKPLTDLKETLFIPLSYTHEWGHFVGEFKEVNGQQTAEFLHYIDEDHTSEEDVSRTIRQLKKSFEKIFENFSKNNFQEFIAIDEEIGCLNIDDESFNQSLSLDTALLQNLFFIGKNAPVQKEWCVDINCEYSTNKVTQLARGLLVEHNSLKKI